LVAHFVVGPGWATLLLLVLSVVTIARLRWSGTRHSFLGGANTSQTPHARAVAISSFASSHGNE
jgi:hypothetical protein